MTVKALSALTSDITTLLADNTSGDVEASEVNTLLDNILESVYGRLPYVAKTADYTATDDDCVIACDATSAAVTITLPAVASTRVGKLYVAIKTDAGGNAVTFDGDSSETINGATTKATSTQYAALVVINTGSAWLGFALTGL